MTKDEAKTVCVQPAQDLRSFPEAADGRPMPPMGDELMTACLNCEDARFVAIQLAQNGLMLAPAEQGGAEVELVTDADELRAELRRALAQIDSLEAECDRLHAQTEAAKNDVYRLAVAICGGEDFPGLLEATCIEALVDIARKDSQSHSETINAMLRAEAEVADLRHDLARLKASETDAINDVDRLMCLIRLAHPVMRECGWQLAPACAAEGSDGILEAACAEIEEEFRAALRAEQKGDA